MLDELPGELHAFLLDTCVLGRLRDDVCDELRRQPGSDALLEELERRQLVSSTYDDGAWFRAHEVLRAYLETTYLRGVGETEGRARYLWAGSLLESAGALADAFRAYLRAEAWDAVGRVLGLKGDELSASKAVWMEGPPPAVLNHDPWLQLADARRMRAVGNWAGATAAYQRA